MAEEQKKIAQDEMAAEGVEPVTGNLPVNESPTPEVAPEAGPAAPAPTTSATAAPIRRRNQSMTSRPMSGK